MNKTKYYSCICVTNTPAVFQSFSEGMVCFGVENTQLWQPGKITTFVLPVIEIVQNIGRIKGLMERSVDATVKTQLQKQLDNWDTVLTNYRDHSKLQAQLFTADSIIMNSIVNANARGQDNPDYNTLFNEAVHHNKEDSGVIYETAIYKAFNDLAMKYFVEYYKAKYDKKGKYVESVPVFKDLYSARRAYTDLSTVCGKLKDLGTETISICSEFRPNLWHDVFSAVDGACHMPLDALAEASENNQLSATPLVQKLCLTSNNDVTDIPGGDITSNKESSLFSFLNNNDKYLTFSSFAGVTLSYTSTVTEMMDIQTTFHALDEYAARFTYDIDLSGGGHIEAHLLSEDRRTSTVSVGRSSGSSHVFERTVTINLGDGDDGAKHYILVRRNHSISKYLCVGDLFALRITEDSVFGTPVFTTIGGQSKCPAETATLARESGVELIDIIHMCGDSGSETCSDLEEDEKAYFSAVIFNNSPTSTNNNLYH